MRRLMLLRHAKTEADAPSGRDHDRRLDDRGQSDAGEIGHWIARNPPFPNLVLVSSAVRAQQTWNLAWEAMKDRVPAPEVETVDELYGAEPTQLLTTVRMASANDPKRLMLVGHNPGLEDFARKLIKGGETQAMSRLREKFPTAALAVIDFDAPQWAEISWGAGTLVRFDTPKSVE